MDPNNIDKRKQDIENKIRSSTEYEKKLVDQRRNQYASILVEFKKQALNQFKEKGIDSAKIVFYGEQEEDRKDLICVSFIPDETTVNKLAHIVVYLQTLMMKLNLDQYFSPEYVGTNIAAIGMKATLIFARTNTLWSKFKKQDVDYITGQQQNAGGGGY